MSHNLWDFQHNFTAHFALEFQAILFYSQIKQQRYSFQVMSNRSIFIKITHFRGLHFDYHKLCSHGYILIGCCGQDSASKILQPTVPGQCKTFFSPSSLIQFCLSLIWIVLACKKGFQIYLISRLVGSELVHL